MNKLMTQNLPQTTPLPLKASPETLTEPDRKDDRLYARQFFQVFAATGVFMVGVSLQFHFGQYVEFLGYGVDTLGWILSISMIGTLVSRLFTGSWIDRFGIRRTWLGGSVIVAVTIGSLQFISRPWLIVVLRTVSVVAMSAVMTSVAVFAAIVAPAHRRAESIGTIGLAGFVGMVLGPTLGDFIFSSGTTTIFPYRVFFTAAAGCSLISALIVMSVHIQPWQQKTVQDQSSSSERKSSMEQVASCEHGLLREKELRTTPRTNTPLRSQIRVLHQHWPGMVLLCGLVFGMGYCMQTSFLERLAEYRGFKDIKLFFLIYGPTAITLRLIFRRLPQQMGRTRTLLLGMVLYGCGFTVLASTQVQWQLIGPGLLLGAGHCFIFPSMIDLAAERLPQNHRGTGTAVILGAVDLGLLAGFMSLGQVIDHFGFSFALYSLSSVVALAAIIFAVSRRQHVFSRIRNRNQIPDDRV